MAEIAGDEKEFHHFNDLSPNLRMLVIDGMEPADRCRFTRCSRRSCEEAKASKWYLYELNLSFNEPNSITIGVFYSSDDIGFRWIFRPIGATIYRSYQSMDDQKSWHINLNTSEGLFELALEKFHETLQTNQHSVKKLKIDEALIAQHRNNYIDFDIESLANLETLILAGNLNIHNLLSKVEKPLAYVYLKENGNEGHEQIYKVTDHLCWLNPNIRNEQFLRIRARFVYIPIGQLTERNLLAFIRSWQNGTIGREIYWYQFEWKYSNFDKIKLLRLLRVRADEHTNTRFEIKSFINPGRIALLLIHRAVIHFKPEARLQ